MTNDHLSEQATELARLANDLKAFFRTDPELPPLKTAETVVSLEAIKKRLQRLGASLKAVARKAGAVEPESNGHRR
jgi:hypothetical protein